MKAIPCKTFLVGEYAVLVGGEALGLATGPGFTLSSEKMSYHPESAVSLFLAETDFYKVVSTAPGGFGKSTAEFIFAYLEMFKSAKLDAILKTYLSLYDQNLSQRPSGADVVIQCLGGISHIHQIKEQSQKLSWPFIGLGFMLISTGLKIATHEHLKTLNRNAILDLPGLSASVIKAFKNGDQKEFYKHLKLWRKILEDKGLMHPHVLSLMQNLQEKIAQKIPSDFIIKQCGAFGADVVIIIFEKNQKEDITNIIKSSGLSIVATENDLMDGALA